MILAKKKLLFTLRNTIETNKESSIDGNYPSVLRKTRSFEVALVITFMVVIVDDCNN